MTDFDNALTLIHRPAALTAAPAAMPADPSAQLASGYRALRAMLPMMMTVLRNMIGRRGAKGLARRMRADVRRMYNAEKAAMGDLIKQALRSCPDWRARVFEDLGGDAALARWEARLMRPYAPPLDEDYSWLDDDPNDWPVPEAAAPRGPAAKRPRRGPRLDRDGLFRWARIAQSRDQRRAKTPRTRATAHTDIQTDSRFQPRRAPKPLAGPWPLEVRPCDLLDPPEPEDVIRLTLNPAALWEMNTEDLQNCRAGLDDMRPLIWPD